MQTLQSKVHDLMRKQKDAYPLMVKHALKGKTGMSRAQVQQTIKSVAKDYRDQYGATPRKRYLNAVKQAASTMPKATKPTAKKAAKATKPATPKRKTKVEVMAEQRAKYGYESTLKPTTAKTEGQKYAEAQAQKSVARIQRRNERIRQRTEAAIANHKLEQAKAQKTTKQQIGGKLEVPFYAIYKSEKDKPLYQQYQHIHCFKKCRLSKGKTAAKYEYLSKSNVWFDDIDIRQNWIILNDTEVQQRRSANNEYFMQSKREREAQQEAERQAKIAAEKKAKEEEKAKYLTLNEAFIKQFASDLGLSTATIKAMYKVATDYRDDSMRPAICGLYCDPDGYLVATDAHILAAIKCKIPAKYKDKIYLKSGMLQDGKFPKYQELLPINWKINEKVFSTTEYVGSSKEIKVKYTKAGKFDITDFKEVGKTGEAWDKPKNRKAYATPYKTKIYLIIEQTKKLDAVFKALKENDINVWVAHQHLAAQYIGKNIIAIQMPILPPNH